MRFPSGSSRQRLMVIWFDCRTTCKITDRPTPASTAYCSGMIIVSAKLAASTAFCTVLVFHTDRRSSGLMVRKPTSMSRPARAGMAMWPTRPAKARITTAITAPAIIRAMRHRAPAALFSEVADMDPPTGMPRKIPAITFAARPGR